MPDLAKLSVSNIAWDAADDDDIAELLRRHGVRGIEIAPTKWRADPIASTSVERALYRRAWEERGLSIVAMQALLFGQPQLQLFRDDAGRAELAAYLRSIIDLGADLGAHALVFGSPKNRARGGLALPEAMAIASAFFAELGTYANSRNTVICIEANPPAYGSDFITTTAEAVELCARVDNPGLRVNADLGGMTLSAEDPANAIHLAAPWLAHVHASEPHLAELGASSDHARAAAALDEVRYGGWISIEMRDAGPGDSRAAIERAVLLAQSIY